MYKVPSLMTALVTFFLEMLGVVHKRNILQVY